MHVLSLKLGENVGVSVELRPSTTARKPTAITRIIAFIAVLCFLEPMMQTVPCKNME